MFVDILKIPQHNDKEKYNENDISIIQCDFYENFDE